MSFLEEYRALQDGPHAADQQMGLLSQWMGQRPKELFDELRADQPILQIPGRVTVLTRYADVIEALSRDQIFSVRPYAPRLREVAGEFIVGMENTPEYEHFVHVITLAIRRDDLARVRAFSADCTRDLLAGVRQRGGRFDLVEDVARIVPTRFIADYFGIAADERTVMGWGRALYHEIFNNLANNLAVSEAAHRSGREMTAYIEGLLEARRAEHRAGRPGKDDLVNRLLRLQADPLSALDDATIRNHFIGLTTAMIDNVALSITNVIDELLRRPKEMAGARDAALRGDDELLTQYVYEAWRFNPQNMLLLRQCEEDYVIARHTQRQTTIPRGTPVFAVLISAMFDADALDDPEDFRTDRSLEYDYLHFGSGIHQCLGRYISRVQIVEVVKQLLALEGLRRAPGAEGELQMDGPFAGHLILETDGGSRV